VGKRLTELKKEIVDFCKRNFNIIFMKADNVTVALNKLQYIDKMEYAEWQRNLQHCGQKSKQEYWVEINDWNTEKMAFEIMPKIT